MLLGKWFRIRVNRFVFIMGLLLGSLAWPPSKVVSANDARALQEQAIQRIERYVDHFRRTFERRSLRHQLIQAERELEESVPMFRRGGSQGDAAHSLVKLADIRRYLEKWDSAIRTYQEACVGC